MASDEKYSVEKLDGANWTTWRFQMKHVLLAKDLWGYVYGSTTLTEDAGEQEKGKFKKESQKAFASIVMAINILPSCT